MRYVIITDILFSDNTIKETSTPVNPTGVYPHMPIAGTAPFVTSQGHPK